MFFFHGIFKTFRSSYDFTQGELAKQLSLEQITIANYESGKATPSILVLKKMIDLYGVSFDYFAQNNECQYPRNLKLLKLSKILDIEAFSEARSSIEGVVKPLMSKYSSSNKILKQDNLEINLSKEFNNNLKEIRGTRKLNQPQLSKAIGISRSLLTQYEYNKCYPSIDKLYSLSTALDVSMHALITGEKLSFHFDDGIFGRTILTADSLLSIEDQKIIIQLLEAIINNPKKS